jgi:hypothetical protein
MVVTLKQIQHVANSISFDIGIHIFKIVLDVKVSDHPIPRAYASLG